MYLSHLHLFPPKKMVEREAPIRQAKGGLTEAGLVNDDMIMA